MYDIFLLVGGEATRLQPLSLGTPKALLTIKDIKIIDLIFDEFLKIGKFDFHLICSEKHKILWEEYVSKTSKNITLHFEAEKLDTAGYIVQNIELLPDSFFCMNGDLLLNVNLEELINAGLSSNNSLIGSIEVVDPSRYGVIEIADTGQVLNFIEKPKDLKFGNKISLGFYHLYKSDILEVSPSLGIPCSFERNLFPLLAKKGLLDTFTVKGNMIDVGTLESYIAAHIEDGSKNWISNNNVHIDSNVFIQNSVILENCIVENNVSITNSVISPNSTIKSGSNIKHEIVRT